MLLQQTPPRWASRIETLAAPLRAIVGTRHQAALCVSGALLQRGVTPAAVPAIVHDAALAAGWNRPAHHRKNAVDTVNKHASGQSIRSDVSPPLSLALDTFAGVPLVPSASLASEQSRLRRVMANASRGRVTVVRAPCGLGKTQAAIGVAIERAGQGLRTVISVPTNGLAMQVADSLRERGAAVRRLFGPASHPDCHFRPQARALAAGGLSTRWELCDGRKGLPCPHREGCKAAEGAEGAEDAFIIVGNHGLLPELAQLAGTKGLLIIDEPPEPMLDVGLDAVDIGVCQASLAMFDRPTVEPAAEALHVAGEWLTEGVTEPDPDLADEMLMALKRGAPVVQRQYVAEARGHLPTARRIGDASAVIVQLHWALTQAGVNATRVERYGSGEQELRLTGLQRPLAAALRRDGKTVVMAADAHLYAAQYAALLGYEVTPEVFTAPDGCAVRRVLLQMRAATRTQWIHRGNKPARVLQQALAIAREAGPKVAIVTYKALVPWVRKAAPGVELGHYGALRGLNHWKGHDALITLGDPWRPPDVCDRIGVDPEDAARAELEQAHGRLRVVHRKRPCTMVHVGALVPLGWKRPVEVVEPARGRPRRPAVDIEALKAMVASLGGQRAAGRALERDHKTISKWLKGKATPAPQVLEQLRSLAASAASLRGADGVGT